MQFAQFRGWHRNRKVYAIKPSNTGRNFLHGVFCPRLMLPPSSLGTETYASSRCRLALESGIGLCCAFRMVALRGTTHCYPGVWLCSHLRCSSPFTIQGMGATG